MGCFLLKQRVYMPNCMDCTVWWQRLQQSNKSCFHFTRYRVHTYNVILAILLRTKQHLFTTEIIHEITKNQLWSTRITGKYRLVRFYSPQCSYHAPYKDICKSHSSLVETDCTEV